MSGVLVIVETKRLFTFGITIRPEWCDHNWTALSHQFTPGIKCVSSDLLWSDLTFQLYMHMYIHITESNMFYTKKEMLYSWTFAEYTIRLK